MTIKKVLKEENYKTKEIIDTTKYSLEIKMKITIKKKTPKEIIDRTLMIKFLAVKI